MNGKHEYQTSEYQLVLYPNDNLVESIREIRQNFFEQYKLPVISSAPFIRLAYFKSTALRETILTKKCGIVASKVAPFTVNLQQFGTYPTHTLYIHVVAQVALTQLIRELKNLNPFIAEAFFANQFVIPISQKISPEKYEQIKIEYTHRHYTGSFIAGNFSLLKKTGTGNYFGKVADFQFVNKHIETIQGQLF